MKIRLHFEVPSSVDEDDLLLELAKSVDVRQGLIITTPTGERFDLDLTRVEKVAPARYMEVTG